jgi:pyruvate/2-oxoglutarate dehydrogenase complex dihydrolipoamide acyltransferase (E2) component
MTSRTSLARAIGGGTTARAAPPAHASRVSLPFTATSVRQFWPMTFRATVPTGTPVEAEDAIRRDFGRSAFTFVEETRMAYAATLAEDAAAALLAQPFNELCLSKGVRIGRREVGVTKTKVPTVLYFEVCFYDQELFTACLARRDASNTLSMPAPWTGQATLLALGERPPPRTAVLVGVPPSVLLADLETCLVAGGVPVLSLERAIDTDWGRVDRVVLSYDGSTYKPPRFYDLTDASGTPMELQVMMQPTLPPGPKAGTYAAAVVVGKPPAPAAAPVPAAPALAPASAPAPAPAPGSDLDTLPEAEPATALAPKVVGRASKALQARKTTKGITKASAAGKTAKAVRAATAATATATVEAPAPLATAPAPRRSVRQAEQRAAADADGFLPVRGGAPARQGPERVASASPSPNTFAALDTPGPTPQATPITG